ncbi:TipAS antibiotic-recognition domain-containing protein [Collinsella sp. D33t1_170424_A12]|uniref:TipAS antibiotic-recognition domain-containing protein n=1 Tax=Collinsella sp. D33t1_170424_A12 TaxID=2787135 RepID=UPI001E3DEB88|nr:TipAS antibiotic-recognition domain-containing protein [Collinsella sp. D33t1_170424_A12]
MGKKSAATKTRRLVEDNERSYGSEARARWGDDAVDASNRLLLDLSESEFERFQALGTQINTELEAAVQRGLDPAGESGERICGLHREWLGYTWSFYTPEAHRGLAEMYVADERFTAYYDGAVAGCAAWLHDAICAWAK